MTSTKTFAAASAIAGAVALLATATLPATAQQLPPQGWFKVCSKQEDNDICNTQNIVTADSGQLLTAINLIEIKGKINRKIFQVSVPTGRLIPAGIGMQIDANKTTKVEYGICFPDRCIAEAPLTDEMVNALKKGGKLTLTSVNFQNKPNPITVQLTGFSDALNGKGLQQNELEQRQKELQDAVQKRQKEFEAKMKAEQEKAKAGN
ncbi:invasion associated locus B family protein [Pseudochrobactrum algeriensis]|uniref:Invasion protein IalB n=2 Tax=Pseudochrobactrum TaxID=354349 RepID=A0A7W8AI92_9HYPH|nr:MULTISPECIES: invasion associated locus B family protein [Brucellaceae]MBX8782855.1 invasion associated locus B family protein [Ochrobactrum sp. GRS2]MBX8811391.1 invasion associated locus B family protein [Ochrobactrum sp. MR34]KAB0539139.1 invasion associated locus B family protein [Pseudochrobactrum saccharolyticum]MBB5090843.1 invasion protein IalB [Pseudochrobactrum saccharolyticum]MBX8825023.1 invasion associated locus B family protein [Ochrobactrum sp. SFR4]